MVGVGAQPDANALAANTGYGSAGCTGVPVLSMACVASIAGTAHVCVHVDGTAAFVVPVHAEACIDGGGAATASADASLVHDTQAATAEAVGHRAVAVKDHYECKTTYVEGNHNIQTCGWVYRQDDDIQKQGPHQCSSNNDWVAQSAAGLTSTPLDMSSWLPWWHAVTCTHPDSPIAFVQGVFDCIDASTSGTAKADEASQSDQASLPNCAGGGQRDAAQDNAGALQDTKVSQDLTGPTGASPAMPGLAAQAHVMRLSTLGQQDQAKIRDNARAAFLSFVNRTVENAYKAGQATDTRPEHLLRQACDQLKAFEAAAIEASLSEDFMVRLT